MTGRLRRWGPWLVLVLVLAVGLAIGATRGSASHPTLEGQTLAIAGKVRCPVCQGETAAASDTPAAEGIRARISTDLRKGESTQQILAGLEADFGVSILETPPASGIALWAWVTPVVIAAVAAIGLLLGFRHWRRKSRVVLDSAALGRVPASGGAGAGEVGRASEDDEALVAEALTERALAVQARAGRTRAGRR